jgi:hypothetical protein
MHKLLVRASVVDQRILTGLAGEMAVEVWFEAIGSLEYDVAVEALATHRRESTEYLVPAHLWAIAMRPRADHDVTDEVVAADQARELARAGVTVREYSEHMLDVDWLRKTFPWHFDGSRQLEVGASFDESGDPE